MMLKIYTQNAGCFDDNADAAGQCGAHFPMEHIQGFTKSHWKCLHFTAPAAAKVINFGCKTKTPAKHNF
jgi:hypothetical protein